MKYTDKNYYMDTKLIEKLDLCADRCTGKSKLDNLIVVDGDEGYGKSTMAVACAYYLHHKTGRPFSVANVFFNLDKMIEFATSHADQIIVWDEGALGGLAAEWRSKVQQKLIKLLMVARKKRHIYFFNIPKFFKLNEYIMLDRAIGLIHVYARNEKELGRFVYFRKKSKERLYYEFKRKRVRHYKKFYDFRGTFPNVMSKVIDEVAYDKKKDVAILSIHQEEGMNRFRAQLIKLQYLIYKLTGITQVDKAPQLEISERTLRNWGNNHTKYPEIWEGLA